MKHKKPGRWNVYVIAMSLQSEEMALFLSAAGPVQ